MTTPIKTTYQILTNSDGEPVCDDVPDMACEEQPQNFLKHVVALGATKTGDGLVDPKLVLSWLLISLGAPAFMIGWLVPIREAGALLPQLFVADRIRSLTRRKYVWATGSLIQGMAVVGIALAATLLEGAASGWAILGALTAFALARSICSVSYKDVLGNTISKSTRGTATGAAGTIAAALVFVYGLLLSSGLLETSISVIAAALFVAGGLWVAASAIFASLAEDSSSDGKAENNPVAAVIGQFGVLRNDAQLRRFIATRGLLIATALAPPYLLAIGNESSSRNLGELGLFVIASSLSAILSSYVWGRFADRSSRRVLVVSSIVALAALASAAALGRFAPLLIQEPSVLPLILFVLMLAYQGVRVGRSTHLVDMAGNNQRLAYTAVSNTIIGVLLVAGGLFGIVSQYAGTTSVLFIFALMCAAAACTAYGLREEQA